MQMFPVRAIIPMYDETPGDPNTLDKIFNNGGSVMDWTDSADIENMQSKCGVSYRPTPFPGKL